MKFASLIFLCLLLNQVEAFDEVNFQAPINIDGQYDEHQPRESRSEKLKKRRKKLEQENEAMMQKKIEMLRLKQEAEMTRKLQHMFNQQMKQLESIQ